MLLDLESSGGLNTFGHDPNLCGPVGGPVTEENYRAYLVRRDECGQQGIGPLQLTFRALQDRADALGGAWDPAVNTRVGLGEFVARLRRHTARDSFSLYNTGRAGPSSYADKAMALLPHWQHLIGGGT